MLYEEAIEFRTHRVRSRVTLNRENCRWRLVARNVRHNLTGPYKTHSKDVVDVNVSTSGRLSMRASSRERLAWGSLGTSCVFRVLRVPESIQGFIPRVCIALPPMKEGLHSNRRKAFVAQSEYVYGYEI